MAADVPHSDFEPYAGEGVPQAAPGSPGKDGRLSLVFERSHGETRLVRDYARAPFHVSGTLGHDPIDGAATVCVQSPSGGVAQGDRRDVTVEVGPDAVAHVGTGSATKVFSMTHNYASTDVSLSVASGGHLEYLPEPTILHADARFSRSVTVEAAPDATAFVGGIVVPGRLARGEAFDFECYHARTEIRRTDGLLAADALRLEPGDRQPQVPAILGDARVFGTLFLVAPAADAGKLSDTVHSAVASEDDGPSGNAKGTAGATELPDNAGVLVRALGKTIEPVRERLRRAWGVARRTLLDAPIPERRA